MGVPVPKQGRYVVAERTAGEFAHVRVPLDRIGGPGLDARDRSPRRRSRDSRSVDPLHGWPERRRHRIGTTDRRPAGNIPKLDAIAATGEQHRSVRTHRQTDRQARRALHRRCNEVSEATSSRVMSFDALVTAITSPDTPNSTVDTEPPPHRQRLADGLHRCGVPDHRRASVIRGGGIRESGENDNELTHTPRSGSTSSVTASRSATRLDRTPVSRSCTSSVGERG